MTKQNVILKTKLHQINSDVCFCYHVDTPATDSKHNHLRMLTTAYGLRVKHSLLQQGKNSIKIHILTSYLLSNY